MGIRETFRQNLIYYRKKAGFTQEQLSEKCGCNINYIASIECSSSKFPKPETIDSIAKSLEINASALFLEQGSPINTITFSKEEFSKEIISALSENLGKKMLEFLEKLV